MAWKLFQAGDLTAPFGSTARSSRSTLRRRGVAMIGSINQLRGKTR